MTSTEWTDSSRLMATLLEEVAAGDERALMQLYRMTSSHLLAIILRINRERAQAEEVLQEIFLTIWQQAGRYHRSAGQPRHWLGGIARNRAIDSVRRLQARPRTIVSDDSNNSILDSLVDDSAIDPYVVFSKYEETSLLAQCLGILREEDRKLVLLAFFDGLTHTELAHKFDQPLGTVKAKIRRSLLTLRKCFDAAGVEARL